MAASEKSMGDLHQSLVGVLLEMIRPIEVTKYKAVKGDDGELSEVEDGVRMEYPSAGVLAVVAKVLKDNSIFSTPETDEKLAELQKKLGGRLPSARDMKDALGSIGNALIQ